MKKSLVKIFAGVTAAASLLLASCTNQLDYLDQTTALNKMNIKGFTVTGLDQSYDQATAKLMVKEGVDEDGNDVMVSIGSTTVAKYTATEGYKSGTAYVTFDDPYLYDGDSLETSKLECYLVVGNDEFKVADTANGEYKNAVLKVKTSPAGTADADLVSNYIAVSVYDGVASYAFSSSATEPLAVPVYMCDFDISTAASAGDLPAGVTIDLADKSGTNNKYTVIFKGLVDNVGTKFVVAGASISSTDSNLGDNWNIMETAGLKVTAVVTDKGLISTVDENGEIKFEFYGAKPSWASFASPAIKIAAYNVDTDPWTCLLQDSDTGNDKNFFFPNYTDGHDVTMTVDLATLDTSYWKKSDSKYEAVSFDIVGVKVVNAPTIGSAGYIALCSGWLPDNVWGATTTNKITSLTKGNGSIEFATPYTCKPFSNTFKLGIQALNPASDDAFWADASKIGGGEINTPTYVTTDFANGEYIYVLNVNGDTAVAYLVSKDVVSLYENQDFNVKGIKLLNSPAIGAAGYIAFCESWLPDNVWGSDTTNKVTSLTGNDAILTFGSAVAQSLAYKQTLGVQILNPASDGAFWADASKIGGGLLSATVPASGLDGENVWLVIDCADGYSATFVVD